MLCTEDCCKAALLEALPSSRINNVVKLHRGAELAWPDVCKHEQVCVCGSVHSSPHSLLRLSHAQYQLFAAFTLFLILEVKVSCISVSSTLRVHWQGISRLMQKSFIYQALFTWNWLLSWQKARCQGQPGRSAGFSGDPVDLCCFNKIYLNDQCNCITYRQRECCKH